MWILKSFSKYIILLLFFVNISYAQEYQSEGTFSIYFSPNGGCTDAIITEIASAEKEILIQAYSFTSSPIAQALINSKKKGINIQIIFDKGQKSSKYSSIFALSNANIYSYVDSKHAIQHNKYMIIDQKVLITGSFNFTKNAEFNNAENLLIFKDNKKIIELYTENFYHHKHHSVYFNFIKH